jgi:hypothetical protein
MVIEPPKNLKVQTGGAVDSCHFQLLRMVLTCTAANLPDHQGSVKFENIGEEHQQQSPPTFKGET